MKLKIEYMKKVNLEKKIIKDNDKLRYKIERFKRVEIVEKYSRDNNLKKMGPGVSSLMRTTMKGMRGRIRRRPNIEAARSNNLLMTR